jgi:hypothetical protein
MFDILILSKYEESMKNARKSLVYALSLRTSLHCIDRQQTPNFSAPEGRDAALGTAPTSFGKHANCRYKQIHLRP